MTDRLHIAVVGSGAAGLGAAWALSRRHRVALYEAEPRPGGHCNTLQVAPNGQSLPVDTGFIVYNQRNYPNLTAWFRHLDVATENSDMSFSVQAPGERVEWSGDNTATVFGQPSNLIRPRFIAMVRDILRFNRRAAADVAADRVPTVSLGEYLAAGGYGDGFRRWYLLPMGAAIWSATLAEMERFPARTFLRFFHNHGLLTVNDRPQWRTVTGGSRTYVARVLDLIGREALHLGTPVQAIRRDPAGAEVIDANGGRRRFDHVVLACHADQALALLAEPSATERVTLGDFKYQSNAAILHTDAGLMPRRKRLWASWNYRAEAAAAETERAPVALTYWMNRLQNLPRRHPVFVTLNPVTRPRDETVIREIDYRHPLFDAGAVAAQDRLDAIQGADRVWFCGSYHGYGFHEDALTSGLRVAEALGAIVPWRRAGRPRLPLADLAPPAPMPQPMLAAAAGD
ncbi:MAG: FAD-dependent oxidoreductase [Alphaproteobacteria bacterium]